MEEKYIRVIKSNLAMKIRVSDVVYIERDRRKLHVVTDNNYYEYYESLNEVVPLLDDRFCPCLKSCYINMDKIASVRDFLVTFENGETYLLGRDSYYKTKREFTKYLENEVETG